MIYRIFKVVSRQVFDSSMEYCDHYENRLKIA
jgi:hypothetical protein